MNFENIRVYIKNKKNKKKKKKKKKKNNNVCLSIKSICLLL